MSKLTDLFPLRLTSVWGGFKTVAPIPLRFGTVRGDCVEYVTANLDQVPRIAFVWSDGACVAVDRVYVDGQERFGGWRAGNRMDVTGQPVMMIELDSPAPRGAAVSASGRGLTSAGAMIRNPARVIAELAARAGITAPNLEVFAAECDRAGLECAGEIAADVTIQGAIRQVCESVGAIYSPRVRTTAALYPGGVPELIDSNPLIRAQVRAVNIIGAEADVNDTINALSVKFAHRDGGPSKVMDIECTESIAAVGRRPGELEARFVFDDGIMAKVALRLAPYLATAPYAVTFEKVRSVLRPGDYINVTAAGSPSPFAAGVRQVIAAAYDPATDLSSGEFQVWPTLPAVSIVRVATILEDAQEASATQRIVGSTREIDLIAGDGRPLGGAKCVLDGSIERYANGAGKVTFPLASTPAGWHILTVTINANGSSDPVNVNGGEAGIVNVPGQQVAIPVTFSIRILFT